MRLVVLADRLLQAAVVVILRLVRGVKSVGVGQQLGECVAPLAGQPAGESPLNPEEKPVIGRVAAPVAIAGADTAASHCRGGDRLELWKRPERLRHRAELLHVRVGEVRVRNSNSRGPGQRRIDVRAQQVQRARRAVLLDELVEIRRRHLVDVQQAGL